MRAPHLLVASLPLVSFSLLLPLLPSIAGCNTVQYHGREGYDAACPTQIEYPCKVQPSGGGGGSLGCEGDPDKLTGLAQQIPGDASYPSGCAIVIPIPLADDDGQCIIAGGCRCTSASDAGVIDGGDNLEWICFRSHY